MKTSRFAGWVTFLDFLFLVVIGFVCLFAIAFLLINPIAKHADIVAKDAYMVELVWNDESMDDVDLWVKTPEGPVGYLQAVRSNGLAYLDRDDRGTYSDTAANVNGVAQVVRYNREITYLKQAVDGDYAITVHLYKQSKLDESLNLDQNIKVSLIRLVPRYHIVYTVNVPVRLVEKQEYTILSFSIQGDSVTYMNNTDPVSIVVQKDDD